MEIALDRLPPALRHELWLFCAGLLCLGAGCVLYATARPSIAAHFLGGVSNPVPPLPRSFRSLVGSAPTFIHVVAFSLMSAAIIGGHTGRRLAMCAAWAFTDVVFEWAQMPVVSGWLLQHATLIRSVPYLPRYLAGGTFDPLDVLAAVSGGAFAGLFIVTTRR